MSFLAEVIKSNGNVFYIPCSGKMFFSSVGKRDKALCICLNKGYLQTNTLEDMLEITSDMVSSKYFKLVGEIEKVRLIKSDTIVYRQRVFFKSIVELVACCQKFAVDLNFTDDFYITINSCMNVLSSLVYMERYAKQWGIDIDTWLRTTCIVQLHQLLEQKGLPSVFADRAKEILKGKKGYLDRAPFLVSYYDIDKHTSSVYIPLNTDNKQYYSDADLTKLNFGYTVKNVEKDVREGRI